MNFLSHYYFHRYSHDPELVLGCVLPDFLKNADKTVRLQPEQHELKFLNNPRLESLYAGWTHHVETDRVFHNLPFFYEHTHGLRLILAPVVEDTPIRASFLSHIALELLLDHLLLEDGTVDDTHFYRELKAVDRMATQRFLYLCGMEDSSSFFYFLDQFIAENYLSSYRDLTQVSFALLQICRRIWNISPDAVLKERLAGKLAGYKKIIRPEYMSVFEAITY